MGETFAKVLAGNGEESQSPVIIMELGRQSACIQ